mmetsp:Transcript_7624/g.11060  ORF Transcript_7624/g.11060 Transcript_7624/m.11060 type:complete len:83 (+) Transcript_7624:736-984(+)
MPWDVDKIGSPPKISGSTFRKAYLHPEVATADKTKATMLNAMGAHVYFESCGPLQSLELMVFFFSNTVYHVERSLAGVPQGE